MCCVHSSLRVLLNRIHDSVSSEKIMSPTLPPLGGFWPNAPRSGVVARAQVELVPTASPQSGDGDDLSHNFRARTLAQRRARAIRGGSRRFTSGSWHECFERIQKSFVWCLCGPPGFRGADVRRGGPGNFPLSLIRLCASLIFDAIYCFAVFSFYS